MATLLHLDASARPGRSDERPYGSHTRRLSARFVERWRAARPCDRVVYRDLGASPPAFVSGKWVHAAFTRPEQREPWMREVLAESDALIDELLAADVIVAGVPMYNFGVPAQLKNWIDAIARAKVTFRYTEQGAEGLLKGKKVIAVLTRGGVYRNTPADSQVPYLKTVLAFLGMDDIEFVYAEGLALGPQAEQEALAAAREQIEQLVA